MSQPVRPAASHPAAGRAARSALRASVVSAVLLAPVLLASPASAGLLDDGVNSDLGPREGADLGSGLSIGETVLLYVLVPAAILLGTAALVWLPGMVRGERYRPQKGWGGAPVWFAGPPDPVAAVETAQAGDVVRGGASGSW